MPYQLEPNWEMQSPSGNSDIFYTVSSRTVRKSNDGEWKVNWRALFSNGDLFAVRWHDALCLFCSKTSGDLQFPSPAHTEFSPRLPPPPGLQCKPPVTASVQCLSRKKTMWGTEWLARMTRLPPKGRCCQNQSVSSKGFNLHTTPFSNEQKH